MKFKGVIFDLDQTLVDSKELEEMRKSRNWGKVLQSLHLIKYDTKIVDLLNTLAISGVKIGIITNSPGIYAEKVLKLFGFKFDSLVAYHDVRKKKPDPESFIKILSNLNLTPNLVVSFGDQDNDILASKRAGICAVGAKWYNLKYNFSIQPDYIHSSIDELVSFLKI